jgi:hypothetical protein
MGLMGIGEFARLSRLWPEALRLCDELGLLPACPGRPGLWLPLVCGRAAGPGAPGSVAALDRRPAGADQGGPEPRCAGLKGLTAKGGTARMEASRKLLAEAGGSLESFHFALGQE